MCVISYILMAVGILFLANAGYDEFRGITRTRTTRYTISETIIKSARPETFRNAMTYHWAYGSILLIAGGIAHLIDRGQDKTDPLAPDANENIEGELRQDAMDEEVQNEKDTDPKS